MTKIVIAGATGSLGSRIAQHLVRRGCHVTALARPDSDQLVVQKLARMGCKVVTVDYQNQASLKAACTFASCVVSALSGVRDVILTTQQQLLTACIQAGVPRFIPSDYCLDYRNLEPGQNRNLDLRREFSEILSGSNIRATSILCGMFTDLLDGTAPVILKKHKRIFFWGDADQKMDFTTIDNTAEFTAEVAMDENSPRWLTIAGDVASMRDIRTVASEVYQNEFKFLRPGGLTAFQALINFTKFVAPGKKETFPAWQGMQYLHDMLSGIPKFGSLDNGRYTTIRWESLQEFLGQRKVATS